MTPLSGQKLKMETMACGKNFKNHTTIRVPVQMAGISISYTFGKQGIKSKKTTTTIHNTDQKNQQDTKQSIGTMMIGN